MVHSSRRSSGGSIDENMLLFPGDSVHLARQHQQNPARQRQEASKTHPRALQPSESDNDYSESSTLTVDSPTKSLLNDASAASPKPTATSKQSPLHVHFSETLVTDTHEYEAAISEVDPSRLWYDRDIYQIFLCQARQDVKSIWDFHEAVFANNPGSYVNVLQDVNVACECSQENNLAHESIPAELLDSLNRLYADEETTLFRIGLEKYVLVDSGMQRNARRKRLYTTVQQLQTSFVWLDEEELELSMAQACANWSAPHRLWATLIGQAQGDAEQ